MNDLKEIAVEVQEFLQSQQESITNLLKELVSIETPSYQKEKLHEILTLLKEKFEGMGYFVLHVPGKESGGYLYVRPTTRNKSLPLQLVVGHCDTVWPEHTIDKMPISCINNKAKGPGIYDMKAGLTQIVFALLALQVLSLPIEVTPIILINSDEEIGSRESTDAIKRLARIASRAYVLEPPLGLDGKLKTARKGLGRFTLNIEGKAAHAGLDPDKGINAIVELSHQVQQLYAMNDFDKGITVNVGMIEGGISPNVVAPISRAIVDVRVLTEADGKYITQKIQQLKPKLPYVKLHIEGRIGRPPMEKNTRNQELWKMAEQIGNDMGIQLQQATAGGGSDANTTSVFTATLDGLGTPGDGAHAPHEYILSNKLIERTTLLTLLLLAKPLKVTL